MTQSTLLESLLFGLLMLSSMGAWGLTLRKHFAGTAVFRSSVYPPEFPHRIALWTALLCVLPSVIGALQTPLQVATEVSVSALQSGLVMRGVLILAVLIPLVTNPTTDVSKLGFRRTEMRSQVGEGVKGFLLSVLPVFVIWTATQSLRTLDVQHPLLTKLMNNPTGAECFWICFSAAVAAPIYEELLYRVVIQTSLEKYLSPAKAIVLTSVLFALVHRIPDSLPLFPLALVLGHLYWSKRSFLAVVVAHGLFNATNLFFVLMTARSS